MATIGRFALWFSIQAIQGAALLCAMIFVEYDGAGAGWWLVAAFIFGGIYGSAENLRGYYEGLNRQIGGRHDRPARG